MLRCMLQLTNVDDVLGAVKHVKWVTHPRPGVCTPRHSMIVSDAVDGLHERHQLLGDGQTARPLAT